jgi:transcription initiation factor TFIIIB Brf1 subunit/transcription initiation factor TFIIB
LSKKVQKYSEQVCQSATEQGFVAGRSRLFFFFFTLSAITVVAAAIFLVAALLNERKTQKGLK